MPTNMLGMDVSALEVPAFLAAARHAFAILGVVWLLLSLRVRRPG